MALIAGADACKGGWIAISWKLDNGEFRSGVYQSIAQFIAESAPLAVLAIDIPIGLTDSGPRECDTLARRTLGQPRGSSVFPAPIRPALAATNRNEADKISRSVDGRGVGAQAFGLYSRIRQVDAIVRSDSQARSYSFEVHPELCFMAWNGGKPISESKKSHAGMGKRRDLVQSHFGEPVLNSVRQMHASGVVADDDIYDAFAALWTAHRIHLGVAQVIPNPPAVDSLGIRTGMWY